MSMSEDLTGWRYKYPTGTLSWVVAGRRGDPAKDLWNTTDGGWDYGASIRANRLPLEPRAIADKDVVTAAATIYIGGQPVVSLKGVHVVARFSDECPQPPVVLPLGREHTYGNPYIAGLCEACGTGKDFDRLLPECTPIAGWRERREVEIAEEMREEPPAESVGPRFGGWPLYSPGALMGGLLGRGGRR